MFDYQTVVKRPDESRLLTMRFDALLVDDEIITSVVGGAPTVTPADLTLDITDVQFDSNSVAAQYTGGLDKSKPKIKISVTTSLGNTLTGEGYLRIKG